MEENQLTIYKTVLTNLIDSFSPVISSLQDFFSEKKEKESINSIFKIFPMEIPQYKTALKILTKMSRSCTAVILKENLKVFKNLCKDEQKFFPEKNVTVNVFRSINFFDGKVLHLFYLIFFSDLIRKDVVHNNALENSINAEMVIDSSFLICNLELSTFSIILESWALMLSYISQTNLDLIMSRFDKAINEIHKISPIILLKYLRFDLNYENENKYLDYILDLVDKQIELYNDLSKMILHSFGCMIHSARVDNPERIIKLISPLSQKDSLKEEALSILTILDAKKNVLKLENDSTYSLNQFLTIIVGNNYDQYFFRDKKLVGKEFKFLSFIKWDSGKQQNPNSSDSFYSYFLKYYLPVKENGKKIEFCYILLILISKNFNYFKEKIFSKFMQFEVNDPRYISFLKIIPIVNSESFLKNSISSISSQDLREFNLDCRELVLNSIKSINPDKYQHGVDEIKDPNFCDLLISANHQIEEYLELWKINYHFKTKKNRLKTKVCLLYPKLELSTLNAIPYTLLPEDLQLEEIKIFILKMCFINCPSTSSKAHLLMKAHQTDFVLLIINYIYHLKTNESIYICILFLLDYIKTKPKLKKEILYSIETICMFGLTSNFPLIRITSFNLLNLVNELLNFNGFYSYISQNIRLIESATKQTIINCTTNENPQQPRSIPIDNIDFMSAIYSLYYEIWTIFLVEILNLIIFVNYEPLIDRFRDISFTFSNLSSFKTEGSILMLVSSLLDMNSLTKIKTYYISPLFASYKKQTFNKQAFLKIMKIIFDKDPNFYFRILKFINVTLYQSVIESFINIQEYTQNIFETLEFMLKNPTLTPTYMSQLLPSILQIIPILISYLITKNLNAPRVINWCEENENLFIQSKKIAIEFCSIISSVFNKISSQIDEETWPISSRELVFRLLLNWTKTKSKELEILRNYSEYAITSIVHIGPIITDSLIFDNSTIELLVKMEQKGMKVLSFLLYYHKKLLIKHFIRACYVENKINANYFFDSIFLIFEAEHISFLKSLSGDLLLLGMVYQRYGNHRADEFLKVYIDLISTQNCQINLIPQQFAYATEVVIESAFEILQYKQIYIPVNDIVEIIKLWIPNLRLLPKRKFCVPGVPSAYERFTPYQFLCSLMETTEKTDEDNFSSIVSLWTKLMESPDHMEIIPIFLSEWPNVDSKRKMFMFLITSEYNSYIMELLELRCTFGYYYHITTSLKKSFDSEFWFLPLIIEAFKQENESFIQYLPTIIHFAFLFYDSKTQNLLHTLCIQFSIELPDNLTRIEAVVRSFSEKLYQTSEKYLEAWGLEALKWLFGCRSIQIAVKSLTIYNQLLCPIESIVINGICKAVAFHVLNSYDDIKNLTELVKQAFIFYNIFFKGNELYAFKFASSFLDCKIFVDKSLPFALQLFMKSLSSMETNQFAWRSIIAIIRPIIPKLEKDTQYQKILEMLIDTSKSQELMMIAMPIHLSNPTLFINIPPYETLIKTISKSILCKLLVHYSSMIDNASTELLNYIYMIATYIVRTIVNENNRSPLTKIYKSAILNISNCSNAVEFISVIMEYEPSLASKSVNEFYNWNRSLEDVSRSLRRLIIDDCSCVTITDFSNLQSFYNILNSDILLKVLPFSTQNEVMNGMRRVSPHHERKKSQSLRRSSFHGIRETHSNTKITLIENTPHVYNFTALSSPKKLIFDSKAFDSQLPSEVQTDIKDFQFEENSLK